MTKKEQLKLEEEEFYKTQDEYLRTGSKLAWDKMWFQMNKAIGAALKKRLTGIKRNDVDELTMDATIQVMNRYKKPNGYKVQNLLCCAHWAALGVLCNEKQKRIDQELSYEAYLEYEYANEEK